MQHEPTAELRRRQPAMPGVHWIKTERAAAHPPLRTLLEVPPAPTDGRVAMALPGAENIEFVSHDEIVLSRPHFVKEMHREQRRTDRSKRPFSIAVFRCTGDQDEGFGLAEDLLEVLRRDRRETDVLGDLGDRTVAMMLPDTKADGLERFVARVLGDVNRRGFSLSTATYPDTLFDDLLRCDGATGLSHAMFVDQRRKPDKVGRLVKRCVDLVGAGVALVSLAPLMLIVAAVIARTSPGPVIFKQVRLGKGGRPFVFYKFRSMACGTDDRIHREYVTSLIAGSREEAQGNAAKPWAKLKGDPRITPVGRFIRRTSIDELPQLFNVLKGDLSLIGPRPPLPYEAEQYQSWHLRRILEVKPGVSGLWQVAGGYKATFDDMVRLDLRYVRDWSLRLDMEILLKTVLVVLRRQGTN